MPFDPSLPLDNSTIEADELRNQFNGLNDDLGARIDAIPAGPPGGDGPQGPPFASAVVDRVDTLNPGEDATVSATFDGTDVHLTFGLPRGADGAEGSTGSQGEPGEVTGQQLADAVANTARNPIDVPPFTATFSDPPTQAEMLAFAEWSETLRAALVR
jgi:hypothetical protein